MLLYFGGVVLVGKRCIRVNARHTAVVEQSCRAVAAMAEASFTFRTRLIAEKIQDAIHEASTSCLFLVILVIHQWQDAGILYIILIFYPSI